MTNIKHCAIWWISNCRDRRWRRRRHTYTYMYTTTYKLFAFGSMRSAKKINCKKENDYYNREHETRARCLVMIWGADEKKMCENRAIFVGRWRKTRASNLQKMRNSFRCDSSVLWSHTGSVARLHTHVAHTSPFNRIVRIVRTSAMLLNASAKHTRVSLT